MRREPSRSERHRNPFSWRAAQLAAMAGHPAAGERCRELAGELIVAEAAELARGRRHLTVVHGVAESEHRAAQVSTFLANVDGLLPVGWWEQRGGDDHVIIAVAGDGADERIAQLRAVAELCNPGHWRISTDARPDLTDQR